MSDASSAPLPPAAPPTAAPASASTLSGVAKWGLAGLTALFSPVISLVKVRSWWVYLLFGLLAFFMVSIRGELKASLLSSVITLGTLYFGYVVAKIVTPEIVIGNLLYIAMNWKRFDIDGKEIVDQKQGPEPSRMGAALLIVAALAQRTVCGALCFAGTIYMIPSIADKIR